MRFLTYGLWAVLLSAGCSGSLGTLGAGGTGGTGSGGAGAAGTVGSAGSPGTTTLQLALAPTQTYCDENASCTSTQHLFLSTLAGQQLMLGSAGCGTSCSTCEPMPCPDIPLIACPAGNWATAVTDSTFTWDGSYTENDSCEPSGASLAITCTASKIAPAGTYIARFCATPGTLAASDGGPQSCAASGAQECVEVPFDFPSSQPVLVALPSD
jgi:hypothetical protein